MALLKPILMTLGGFVLLGIGVAGLQAAYAPGKGGLQSYLDAKMMGPFVIFGGLLLVCGIIWIWAELKSERATKELAEKPVYCPSCGAPLSFSTSSGEGQCSSCGHIVASERP